MDFISGVFPTIFSFAFILEEWAHKATLAPKPFLISKNLALGLSDLLQLSIRFLIIPDSSKRALCQLPAEGSRRNLANNWPINFAYEVPLLLVAFFNTP
jgi:hypothetical protein